MGRMSAEFAVEAGRAIALSRALASGKHRTRVRIRLSADAAYLVFAVVPSALRWLKDAALFIAGTGAIVGLICWLIPRFG
jgi:hypothetical protein